MEFKDLNLKDNPFKNLVPSPNKELFWAGMREQRDRISKIYSNALGRGSERQVILNWGPIGGGKTHAAYFFAKTKKGTENENILHINVRLPKEGKNATIETIKKIFDNLGIEDIIQLINETIVSFGSNDPQPLIEQLNNRADSDEALINALITLSVPDRGTLGFGDPKHLKPNFQKYIHGTLNATELRKLSIVKPLKTASDYIHFLSIALIAITSNQSKKGKVFLWLDEMEDMLYYSGKEFKQYSQMIRDLTDSVDENMVTFLNFTLTEGEDDSVKMLLGEALWSRIDKQIRFKDLTVEDGFEYCKELIDCYLLDKDKSNPFEDSAIRYVLERIPEKALIPREINKKFKALINYALDHDFSPIDVETVKRWHLDSKEEAF